PSTVPTDGPPLQLLGVASHEPLLVVRSTTGGPVIVTSRYRASYLAFPLQEPGARERWLIDPKGEIVAASGGFQALEQMTNPEVLEAAAAARASGEGSRDVVSEGVVYGWAPVAGEGPAKQLGWVVVSRRSHASLGVADVAARRELILVAVLTGLFSLLLLGWYLITTVLPLRHLSQQATRLADGDRTTQLVPRRLDEVGVIARHLERIRRELRDRSGRRTEGGPEPSGPATPNGTGATDLDTRSGDA
ncbi:MAG: HAMP domain-containing protein, partial [Actinomycetales bacterium]